MKQPVSWQSVAVPSGPAAMADRTDTCSRGPSKRGWRDIVERLRKGSEQLFCVPREPKDHGMALDAPGSQV